MKTEVSKIFLSFILWINISNIALAQNSDTIGLKGLNWNFDKVDEEGFSLGRFFSNTFTPRLILDVRRIRKYVQDDRFEVLRVQSGDLRAADAIYLKALDITDYNIARALFISLMAVLEHRTVELKIPVLSSLGIPLTFEDDTVFHARIKHLPKRLYKDSPTTPFGDKDKLQHFFASAYLSFGSESPEFVRATGNTFEWAEAKVVIGGTDDPRDKRANHQGELFGRDLLVEKTLLPSDYLVLQFDTN